MRSEALTPCVMCRVGQERVAVPVVDVDGLGAIAEELAGLRAEVAGQRAEIAALRGVGERTAQRHWERARLYLHAALEQAP